jgi:hypothetical protein
MEEFIPNRIRGFLFCFVLVQLGFELRVLYLQSRPSSCKSKSILLWLIWRWESNELFACGVLEP